MTNRAITNWWIRGLTAMIPSGSCAVLLAAHPQGVSDGYGRLMVGLIVVGVVGGLRRIPVAALAEFVARRRGAAWREGGRGRRAQGVGEAPGGGVAGGERVAQGPLFPQGGDQGGVPVPAVHVSPKNWKVVRPRGFQRGSRAP